MDENAPLNVGKPYVVIVTPTRELCTQVRTRIAFKMINLSIIIVIRFLMKINQFLFIQIYNEARKFAQGSIIKCCQLYGGTATRYQNNAINVSSFWNYFVAFGSEIVLKQKKKLKKKTSLFHDPSSYLYFQ